jgi:hypothetical protein
MSFAQEREMVRLRHELRRLMIEHRPEEARAVLAKLAALVTEDEEEAAAIRTEIARWQTSLDLGH